MSRAYNAAGKRISSMGHARHGHSCAFCDKHVFGNGAKVSHGRAHVRRGEAVELVKYYGLGVGYSRFFLAPDDQRVQEFEARGYEVMS